MIDIVIQAGHEGRTSGNTGTGGTPAIGDEEIKLTPIVADRMAQRLRDAGFNVVREDAAYATKYECRMAVALHYDGSGTPCSSGASVGYPDGVPAGSNKPMADAWKRIYSEVWPFKWMNDNFTAALKGYYGYAYTSTVIGEMVIELGELSCPAQSVWLVTHTHNGFLGDLLAYWASVQLGRPIAKPRIPSAPSQAELDEMRKQLTAAKAESNALRAKISTGLASAQETVSRLQA